MVILIGPLRQALIGLVLHLQMDQNPFLAPVQPVHLHQFVHALRAQGRVPGDLLQFFVEELESLRPIKRGFDVGKAKPQNGPQVTLQNLLPETVIFGISFAHPPGTLV